MFGRRFKVLKELPSIFVKVGDEYPEYFYAYDENGELEYYIIDNNFGQPSPANTHEGEYAKKLRNRSSKILENLMKDGYIEFNKEIVLDKEIKEEIEDCSKCKHFKLGIYETDSWCYLYNEYTTPVEVCTKFEKKV